MPCCRATNDPEGKLWSHYWSKEVSTRIKCAMIVSLLVGLSLLILGSLAASGLQDPSLASFGNTIGADAAYAMIGTGILSTFVSIALLLVIREGYQKRCQNEAERQKALDQKRRFEELKAKGSRLDPAEQKEYFQLLWDRGVQTLIEERLTNR